LLGGGGLFCPILFCLSYVPIYLPCSSLFSHSAACVCMVVLSISSINLCRVKVVYKCMAIVSFSCLVSCLMSCLLLCWGVISCMPHVQQQHVLHARSNICECFDSTNSLQQQIYSAKTKYINISIYTLYASQFIHLSKSCHDRIISMFA
jgi:hypothetical protein